MRKSLAIFSLLSLCLATMPAFVVAQNRDLPSQAQEHRAEFSRPLHYDTTTKPLREMFETGERALSRGGRDFEPGRPQPVGNVNPGGIDPLAERSIGSPSAFAQPKPQPTAHLLTPVFA